MSFSRRGKPITFIHQQQNDEENTRKRTSHGVIKYDVEKVDSNAGPSSTLNLGSDFDDVNEKIEDSACGSGSKLNLDDSNQLGTDDNRGKRVDDKFEGLNLSDEIDEDDPVQRLEELRLLCDQEIELSEEVASINSQLQEDEILAMEYIYGHNFITLENQSGLRRLQVHIHVKAPEGLSITAKFSSSNSLAKRDDDSSDFAYSFGVEYLQPITLTCLLPKSYPSNHAPFFTISVQWLNSARISDLCCKLDSIWQEHTGQEVIYQWVEWLRDFTLQYLNFDRVIVLEPFAVSKKVDRRAISGSISPDRDIPLMKSYNDEQLHENFCRNMQDCCICFSEFPGLEFIRLPCQHFFCLKCMKIFSEMHIAEGTVMKLQCPEAKCGGMIPPGLLKRILGEEEYEHWESLMLQKALESMNDVVYCPRCETACIEDEDEDNHAQCSKCLYSFCTLCRERRHVGVECMSLEMKLLILEKRQKSTLLGDEQRRREKDMINQLLSLRTINSFAKQCPNCKMAISRTEGCNKMVCYNCGQYFCYRCNKAISGYEHFQNGDCELFPEEELRRWGARRRRPAGQNAEDPETRHHCPSCRRNNVKVANNNLIVCQACGTPYCYLCKKTVRQSTQHYGPKGCKRHTVGRRTV